jgi:hypothetical protein
LAQLVSQFRLNRSEGDRRLRAEPMKVAV